MRARIREYRWEIVFCLGVILFGYAIPGTARLSGWDHWLNTFDYYECILPASIFLHVLWYTLLRRRYLWAVGISTLLLLGQGIFVNDHSIMSHEGLGLYLMGGVYMTGMDAQLAAAGAGVSGILGMIRDLITEKKREGRCGIKQRLRTWYGEYRFEILFCALYILLMYIVIPVPIRLTDRMDMVWFIWAVAAAVFVLIVCFCRKHFVFAMLAVTVLSVGVGITMYESWSLSGLNCGDLYIAFARLEAFLIILAALPAAALGTLLRIIADKNCKYRQNPGSERKNGEGMQYDAEV